MASLPSCTEHDEIEIATAHLETDETSGASGDRLHVLVEKHRGRRDRQRACSSPRPSLDPPLRCEHCRSDAASLSVVPPPASRGDGTDARALPADSTLQKQNQIWKLFSKTCAERVCDEAPALVEVYWFESGGAQYMSTAGSAPPGACERLAGQVTRTVVTAVAGLVAAAGTLLALPIAVTLAVQSAALRTVRTLAAGCVQNVSDYALKPALAVTFNAALRPVLMFLQQVGGAVRETVRPVSMAITECVEPVVRLLAAIHLVEVRMEPRCGCRCGCRTAAIDPL